MKEKGNSIKYIMHVLQRSETAIRKAIKSVSSIKKPEKRNRPLKLSRRIVAQIIRKGSKSDKRASNIRAEVEAPVTIHRFQQIIHALSGCATRKRSLAQQ